MNYKASLKSASACIRHLRDNLEVCRAANTAVGDFWRGRVAKLEKCIRLYKEDNRERAELIEDIEAKRKVIDAQYAAITARDKSLVELEDARAREEKRANAAESVQELANIKIEQLLGHRIWLAIAIGMFIAKDAALYFGLL